MQRAVIIAVNPMPRLYIESLVRELVDSHEVKVLSFYRTPLLSPALISACERHGADVVQVTFRGRVDYLRQARAAGRALRGWFRTAPRVDVFHCQPNHLMTNYPTFAAKRRWPGKIHVHLIPDGLANFYLTSTGPYERSMRVKAVLGKALGLSFTPYRQNYLALGVAHYEDYWYVGNPGLMGEYLPLREFQLQAQRAVAPHVDRQARSLFVGQPPSRHPEFKSTYRSVIASAMSLSPDGLDYKPHPSAGHDEGHLAWLRSVGVRVIHDDDMPAELLAQAYGALMGVASSVTFNVRMLGWSGRVFAVTDLDQLRILTQRSDAELAQIVRAAQFLGINPLSRGPGD